MIDISECSNDPAAIAEAIYDSNTDRKLFDEAREIFPSYSTDGEVTIDAADWIVTRLANQAGVLDALPDEVTNKVIDHLFDMIIEGLT